MNRLSQFMNKPVKGGIALTDDISPPAEGIIKAEDILNYNYEETLIQDSWQLVPEVEREDNEAEREIYYLEGGEMGKEENGNHDQKRQEGNGSRALIMARSIEREHSTLTTCMINLLKTILGAGMLAMPSAMATVGYLPGISFIIIAALLAAFGLELLLDCSVGFGRMISFTTISRTTFPKWSCMFDVVMAVKCFGVSITYLIVIGDTLPGIVEAFGIQDKILLSRYLWISLAMFPLVPLTFLKRLNSLKYTSAIGLIGVVYLTVLSIYNLFYDIASGNGREGGIGENPLDFGSNFTWRSALQVFPVFIFAFTCHQNIYAIQRESKDSSSPFIKRLVSYSIIFSTLIYVVFSLASCMNFGSKTKQNIFLNYPLNVRSMIFARIFFALLAAFSFPLMTHPCRNALLSSFFPDHFNVVTVAILIGTFGVAMIQSDLRLISGVIGAVAGIPICYIFPSLFYYKMNKMSMIMTHSPIKLVCSIGLGIFGAIAMILTLTSLIISAK